MGTNLPCFSELRGAVIFPAFLELLTQNDSENVLLQLFYKTVSLIPESQEPDTVKMKL